MHYHSLLEHVKQLIFFFDPVRGGCVFMRVEFKNACVPRIGGSLKTPRWSKCGAIYYSDCL